jgi:ATP-binding cassette subfamily F protein 3
MLQLVEISRSYDAQTVLQDVSFVLNRSEHAGLVGPNGSGKTTLLEIIAGAKSPDRGAVRLGTGETVGYLPQGLTAEAGGTLETLVRRGVGAWETARKVLLGVGEQLANDPTNAARLADYSLAEAEFEAHGGYAVQARLDEVMRGLGLDRLDLDLPVEKLSGGQRTRAGLAQLLIAEPDILLLDEPTNHLDPDALEWLEKFIRQYSGAALIVSHDRVFLDRTVTQILDLDDSTHRVTVYQGNYSEFQAAKEHAQQLQWTEWQAQQDELERLKGSAKHLRGIARFRQGGKADTNDKFAKGFFANRSKATVARAKQLEKRIEHLQGEGKLDKPRAGYSLKLDFADMPRSGQIVLTLENVGHRFAQDPLAQNADTSSSENDGWLFHDVNAVLRHGERIALLGANGAGKSTLLRMIVGELEPRSGRIHHGANVRVGYMPQQQEILDARLTPLALVRSIEPVDETTARHLLHKFMFVGDEVFAPIGRLSHGERARLILAKLVLERSNFLVLDEPINHLDIASRERFEAALAGFPGAILAVIHDRAFIERFASGIWALQSRTLGIFTDLAAIRPAARGDTAG